MEHNHWVYQEPEEGQEWGEGAGGAKHVESVEIIKYHSSYLYLLFRAVDLSMKEEVETSKDKNNQVDADMLSDCSLA